VFSLCFGKYLLYSNAAFLHSLGGKDTIKIKEKERIRFVGGGEEKERRGKRENTSGMSWAGSCAGQVGQGTAGTATATAARADPERRTILSSRSTFSPVISSFSSICWLSNCSSSLLYCLKRLIGSKLY